MLAAVVLIGVICFGIWLYFYTADLPSTARLADFNPTSPTKARLLTCDGIEKEVTVLSKGELGRYTVAAVTAAEGKPQSRSPFVSLFFGPAERHVATYQAQLARSIACTQPHRSMLKWHWQVLRLDNAINRRFGQDELLTIYLNRIYLGFDVYGVEDGAKRYFGKPASQLTLDETALLIGMIHAPSQCSPIAHPDRATQRRNSILDDMVTQGSVSKSDADAAKSISIQVVR
jgi:membrane carboxypeptidase/penicillin-binding protein